MRDPGYYLKDVLRQGARSVPGVGIMALQTARSFVRNSSVALILDHVDVLSLCLFAGVLLIIYL